MCCPDNLVIPMPTILIKNVPENVLKELKRLKAELGCKTWADLLSELATDSEELRHGKNDKPVEKAVKNFLDLRCEVSSKLNGHPTALEESRRTRHHESAQ